MLVALGYGWTCATLVAIASYAVMIPEDESTLALPDASSHDAIILVYCNAACCILFALWQVQQAIVFGPLRAEECKAISENLWHYVLVKVVLLGVILDPTLYEISTWTMVLAVSGFFKMSLLVAHKRIQHLSQRGTSWRHQQAGMLVFTVLMLLGNVAWGTLLVGVFYDAGYSMLALLLFESVLISFDGGHTLFRHLVFLLDWPTRCVYYADLVREVLSHGVMLLNYLHIWACYGIHFTLFDVLLFVHLRQIVMSLRARIVQHLKYLDAAQSMEARFPSATPAEIATYNDLCVICMDRMSSAKKLPCGHLFHLECMQTWAQQDPSCPKCRSPLEVKEPSTDCVEGTTSATPTDGDSQREYDSGSADHASVVARSGGVDGALLPDEAGREPAEGEAIFSFNTARWASWLPSLSFEVLRVDNAVPITDEMVRNVQEMFPHIPPDVISADLAATNDVDRTIEHLLETYQD